MVRGQQTFANVPSNNRMQRSGKDKVHAPDCHNTCERGSYALRAQRAVADAGRYAALRLSCMTLSQEVLAYTATASTVQPTQGR